MDHERRRAGRPPDVAGGLRRGKEAGRQQHQQQHQQQQQQQYLLAGN